jgi:hypothetical protein
MHGQYQGVISVPYTTHGTTVKAGELISSSYTTQQVRFTRRVLAHDKRQVTIRALRKHRVTGCSAIDPKSDRRQVVREDSLFSFLRAW